MSLSNEILQACTSGNIDALASMLPGSISDADRETLLRAAARANQASALKILLDLPDPTTPRVTRELILDALAGGRDVYKTLWERDPSIIGRDMGHMGNALTVATMADNVDLVTFLLSQGADPNKSHMGYHTVLEIAAGYASLQIVQLLLENGAQAGGTEALLVTVLKARPEVLRLLCEKGADVDAVLNRDGKLTPGDMDSTGATALEIAASQGQDECVKVLLEFGAAVDEKGRDGRIPLQRAVEGKHAKVIKLLKNAKARGN